jgi:shikimate dehydrogenase
MISSEDLAAIGRCLSNRLDATFAAGQSFAGVIGDAPSQYSKSPRLWNAAFRRLGIDALYLPFDVDGTRLGDLIGALKRCADFLGANVTVPHKVRVMNFLDAIDPGARRIQAVNTIVREAGDRLVGYNTDGEGFIDSLQARRPGDAGIFLPSLREMNVLLLGAGGSARAVGFHVADQLAGGKLLICNRTGEKAVSLAEEIRKAGGDAMAIGEEELSSWAPRVGLIVNCTTKGQGGLRKLPGDKATLLEPYSALAPAHPPSFAAAEFDLPEFERKWLESAGRDIHANHQASLKLAAAIPPHTAFYDLIYHPEETVFLRHGQSTGHPVMNGKPMIVHQAALAFHRRICRAELRERKLDTPETHAQILRTMDEAW